MSAAQPRPLKRRRTDDSDSSKHHALRNAQHQPAHTEPAPQDAVFVQSQLLRSIGAALAIVGYDSVKPSALEAFRAQTEECVSAPSQRREQNRMGLNKAQTDMLHFLGHVTTSMTASRRTTAIPQDFTAALAHVGLASSDLSPHLSLALPTPVSAPSIPPAAAAEPAPANLAPMLGASLAGASDPAFLYVPPHFPPLPSRHAWQSTPVFTARERDPRKMRERATEEGVLAEQALRRLTSANKPGTRRRGDRASKRDEARDKVWRETVGDVLGGEGDDGDNDEHDAMAGLAGLDGVAESRSEEKDVLKKGGGLRVNFDRTHWRRGGGGAVRA
ncbi:hypothetical protein MBLNU459_g2163t1 [Dothideomycetes sp. NU459]